MHALYDADTFGRQTTLLAEAEYVNTGTGSDGSQECGKWCRGRCDRWLISTNGELSKMGVHFGAAGKIYNHLHEKNSSVFSF
jgi:hypothetical protein